MHSHNTRYAKNGNFYTCSVRTTRFGLRGLQMQGKHLWEKLPNNIKGCRTLKSFITSYKRHINLYILTIIYYLSNIYCLLIILLLLLLLLLLL